MNEIDKNKIEDFDIILSKGQSVQSKLISLLKLTTVDYSHIGILIKENDNVFVLHSTPDGAETNGIRYDDLQTFIDLSNVSDFTVLRYQDISSDFNQKLRKEFSRYKTIQAPFDFDFDNLENKKIYCSELVWLIYEKAGLFTAKEFNLNKPIYPKYFLKMNRLMMVNFRKPSPEQSVAAIRVSEVIKHSTPLKLRCSLTVKKPAMPYCCYTQTLYATKRNVRD